MKHKSTYIGFSNYCPKTSNCMMAFLLAFIIYATTPTANASEYYMGTGIIQGDLVYEHNNPNSLYNPNKFPVTDFSNVNSDAPKPIASNNLGVSLDGLNVNLGYHRKDVRRGLNAEIGYYALSGSYYNPYADGTAKDSYFANIDYQNGYLVSRYLVPFGRYFSAYLGLGVSSSVFAQSYPTVVYDFGQIKPFYSRGLRIRLKTVFIFFDWATILVDDSYLESSSSKDNLNTVKSATPFLDSTSINIDTFTFGTAIYFGSGAR